MHPAASIRTAIVVSGVGIVCATGHTAPMAYTSVRAGLARLGESPELFIRDWRKRRLAVNCAAVAGVTDGHRRFLRLYRLAVRAFAEAVAHARLDEAMLMATPVFVALAEVARPGLDERAQTDLMRRISQAIGTADLSRQTSVFPAGHAGAYGGLQQALSALAEGRCERAIVGGVDSYLDELSLQWLYDTGRLKGEDRPGGFVPGEAAAFIVIEQAAAARQRDAGAYARVAGAAQGLEQSGVYEKAPCTGEGLTRTIRAALQADGGPAGVSLVLCDLNGERHRAHEWGLAMSRCFQGRGVPQRLWHGAEGHGDIGAASGALNLALATLAIARADAGSRALAWGASDDGERGAAVLAALHEAPAKVASASWA